MDRRERARWRAAAGAVLAVSLLAGACGDDDDESGAATEDADTATTVEDAPETTAVPATTEAPSTTAAPDPLTILVTNDDGVGSEGIDAVVEALRGLPDVEVVVIAPAENQSGSGDTFTEGGSLVATETTTLSGYPAVAVAGYPADSVIYALDQGGMAEPPDLVVSGLNEGQNVGPFSAISGTVGAARTAARRGIPAVAASQGVLLQPDGTRLADYEAGVEAVLAWVEESLDEVAAGEHDDAPVTVWNLNVPTCAVGEVRGIAEAPIAPSIGDRSALETNCESTLDAPVDDIDAFINGLAALTETDIEALDALIAEIEAGA